MVKVVKSTILDHPIDRVWETLRDFNGHDRWHPAVRESHIERGRHSDTVGCVRRFRLADGSELREQLLALSDAGTTLTYCLLDTPVPLFNYVATLRLLPVTDGDRTFWQWESTFSTREGEDGEMRQLVGEQIYQAGFEAIRNSPGCRAPGRKLMAFTVKTFATAAEAAGQLAADRAARFMGGGTLVMRGVNEAVATLSMIVMARDGAMKQIEARGERISIGAAVTMSDILASRDLEFLHPAARVIGGPAVRNMATLGGNLFARPPFGDLATALLALDAEVHLAGSSGARPLPLADFLRDRDREPRPLVVAVSITRPRQGAFRFRKVSRIKPKGAALLTIAVQSAAAGRPDCRGAGRLRRHGAGAAAGAGGGTGTGGQEPR